MRDFYATVEWLQHFIINLYVHLLLQFHFCSTQNLKFYYMKLLLFLLFYLFIFFAAFKHPIDTKDKNTPLTSSYSDIALDYQTRPVNVEKLFILRGLTSSWQYWCYERVFSSSKSCLFELLSKYKCCLNILSHAWLSTFVYHLSWILVSLQDAYHEPHCVFWEYTNAYVWFSFCSSQEIHHKEQSRFNTWHREDAKFVFEGCVFLCLFYYCLSFFLKTRREISYL